MFIQSLILSLFLVLQSCGSSYSGDGDPAESTASYKLTFTATWDANTHPSPSFPSNPHFSKLVGATHKSDYSMWKADSLASNGIKDMAELGAVSTLSSEINAEITKGNAYKLIVSDTGLNPSPGEISVNFEASKDFPLLSITSMIAPSPDWFVGVHDLKLFDGYYWITEKSIDLFGYDAGTDSGTTYTADNSVTNPKVNISELGTPLKSGVKLGTFKITKQSNL